MSNGPTGYTAYRHEGWGAEHGEVEKNSSRDEAIVPYTNVKFVPFSLETLGLRRLSLGAIIERHHHPVSAILAENPTKL